MDLKQLFLTRSHDGYLGKEDNNVSVFCNILLNIFYFYYYLKFQPYNSFNRLISIPNLYALLLWSNILNVCVTAYGHGFDSQVASESFSRG